MVVQKDEDILDRVISLSVLLNNGPFLFNNHNRASGWPSGVP